MNATYLLYSALIAAAFGFWAPAGYAGMMEDHVAGAMSGMLKGAGDHRATGTVSIAKDASGNPILLLTDITVDKVPDGRVYLAKNADYTKGVELGKLTTFSGTVRYAIPANVNPADYNSVVIWCQKFSVEIGHAMFDTGMMKKDGTMMDKEKGMMK